MNKNLMDKWVGRFSYYCFCFLFFYFGGDQIDREKKCLLMISAGRGSARCARCADARPQSPRLLLILLRTCLETGCASWARRLLFPSHWREPNPRVVCVTDLAYRVTVAWPSAPSVLLDDGVAAAADDEVRDVRGRHHRNRPN